MHPREVSIERHATVRLDVVVVVLPVEQVPRDLKRVEVGDVRAAWGS